jgi:hypothetical protein
LIPLLPARVFTILEINPLASGYCELTLQPAAEFLPLPGHYVSAVLGPDAPLSHSPVIKAQTADKFQVLSWTQTQIARGTRISDARIEGETPIPDPAYPQLVLVSDNIALACSIFAASRLRTQYEITVFAHFDSSAPFKPAPSQIFMPSCPPEVIAAVPLLDSWNIPSRLTSLREQNGFYHGDICQLLELWWQRLAERAGMQILGYGSHGFLGRLEDWCRLRQIPLGTAAIPAEDTEA